jgi:hypothetical protein
VHINQSSEKGKGDNFLGSCDTLETKCIKVIYVVIAGDLNARTREALSTEGEGKILKIQTKNELDLKRRIIFE